METPEATAAAEDSRAGSTGAVALTAGFVALALALYYARSWDDNRLTSWEWAFRIANPRDVLVAVVLALPAAWWLSGFRLPGARAIFVLASVSSALFWATPEVVVDAARYMAQAKYVEMYGVGRFLGEWGREVFAWTDMPLPSLLWGMLFSVLGEGREWVLLTNSLMFGATAALTARLGSVLFDDEVGSAGGLFVMAMPYLYSQTPLMMVDVGSMFSLMLAAFSFHKAIERGGGWIPGASLAIAGAVFVKYSLWVMLSVVGVQFAVSVSERGRTALSRGAIAGIGAICIAAPFLWLSSDTVSAQVALLRTYQRPGLLRWGESFRSTFLWQVHPFVAVGALAASVRAARLREVRFAIVAWLPLLLVVLMGVRRSRYLLPMLPMVAIMAAYGWAGVRSDRLRRYAVCLAALTSIVFALTAFLPLLERMPLGNLRAAGRFLDRLPGTRVMVVTMPQDSDVSPFVAVPILDLYTRKEISYGAPPASPLSGDALLRSPVRFTWEQPVPRYYVPEEGEGYGAVVVIAPGDDSLDLDRFPGYGVRARFETAAGLFSFRPFAYVLQPVAP